MMGFHIKESDLSQLPRADKFVTHQMPQAETVLTSSKRMKRIDCAGETHL